MVKYLFFVSFISLSLYSCRSNSSNSVSEDKSELSQSLCVGTNDNLMSIKKVVKDVEMGSNQKIDTTFCFGELKFAVYPTGFFHGSSFYSLFVFNNNRLITPEPSVSFFKIFNIKEYKVNNANKYYSILYEYYAQDSYWIKFEVINFRSDKIELIYKDNIYFYQKVGSENEDSQYNSFDIEIINDSIKVKKDPNSKKDYLNLNNS